MDWGVLFACENSLHQQVINDPDSLKSSDEEC